MEAGRPRASDRGSGGLGLAERYRFEAVLSRGDSIPGLRGIHGVHGCKGDRDAGALAQELSPVQAVCFT